DGSYTRAGRNAGDLAVKLDGSVDLGSVSSSYRGRVTAAVDVARTRGKWLGTVSTKAVGLGSNRTFQTIDADAKLDARGGKLTADIAASSTRMGTAKVIVDVD